MNVKQVYEKMMDFRQFGIVLLTVAVFFYLGMIIPSDVTAVSDKAAMTNKYIAVGASSGFLLISVIFLSLSRTYRKELIESEEGQEYLFKQKRP